MNCLPLVKARVVVLVTGWQRQRALNIEFFGVDHSPVMLATAESSVNSAAEQAGTKSQFLLASAADFCIPAVTGGFDLIVLGGGSFHHFTTLKEQELVIRNFSQYLRRSPNATGIIHLMPDSHMSSDDAFSHEPFQVNDSCLPYGWLAPACQTCKCNIYRTNSDCLEQVSSMHFTS